MSVPRVRRLTCVLVAAALTTTLAPAVTATAEPTPQPHTPPPLSVVPQTPQRESARTASGLRDAGVAEVYQQWRAGEHRSKKGVARNSLRVQLGHADRATAALARKLGATNVETVTDSVVVADVPFEQLQELQDAEPSLAITLPTTVNVVPAEVTAVTATSDSNASGGEIVTTTNAATWHAAGLTGAGVRIGVIDLFDRDAWQDAATAGEVDASRLGGTFCRENGQVCDLWSTGEVHGVAVTEILHDMAPGATVYLASADTLADTRAAIDYFASKGVKIISRSLTSPYDGPGDGTGPSAELVDYAVGKGMAWFNSAGNAGRYLATDGGESFAVGGYWRGRWRDDDGDGWLDFTDPAGVVSSSNLLPVACGFLNGLRWNDWGESRRSDYDLYAYSTSGRLIAQSLANQAKGADPLEGVIGSSPMTGNFNTIDCDDYPVYYLGIKRAATGADTNDVLEILVNSALFYYASTPYSAAHPFADSRNPGAVSIGAVDPVAGGIIADYSSQGPTNDGRIKPDLSAGAGFSSYTYLHADDAGDGSFSGTSASAPVVSGAAALVLQSEPSLTPAKLVAYLKQAAVVDRGKVGADNLYGAGELRLRTAGSFTTTATPPTISGTPQVGLTLTAKPPSDWTPTPTSATYRWFADGSSIAGASGASFTLTAAQLGKRMTVQLMSATRAGYLPVSGSAAVSSATAPVAIGALTTAVPKISGALAAGQKLAVATGTWTTGTKFSYQWYASGTAIKGATKASFTLTKAQNG
ncbi:MAG: S8 family serine peptidase, partial [Propionicimonas sp.]|uniref:S8 family serine peptidase n=1 Tax=Propionicimonas sp. TaxID=1955623 RepID=UPI002B21BA62